MSALLNFPQPLVERYRPRTIADFIGLRKTKKILRVFAGRPYPSAWLFLGYSGVGKTTMALALKDEIGAELHHIASRACDLETVNEITRVCWYIPKTFHLVLVDEADEMTVAAQDAFLSKLDATAWPPKTIFIFTANSPERLADRFLSRCRTLIFEPKSFKTALPKFLRKVYKAEGGNGSYQLAFEEIAQNSEYNVRDALNALEVELMVHARIPRRRKMK
jgi:replication-associated recombination protein RarA